MFSMYLGKMDIHTVVLKLFIISFSLANTAHTEINTCNTEGDGAISTASSVYNKWLTHTLLAWHPIYEYFKNKQIEDEFINKTLKNSGERITPWCTLLDSYNAYIYIILSRNYMATSTCNSRMMYIHDIHEQKWVYFTNH